MTFLVQIKKTTDGTYTKGTSSYETEKEALGQLHTALASAMNKDDTASIMCLLTDEYGSMKKKEYWSAPAKVTDEAETEA